MLKVSLPRLTDAERGKCKVQHDEGSELNRYLLYNKGEMSEGQRGCIKTCSKFVNHTIALLYKYQKRGCPKKRTSSVIVEEIFYA